jgi:biotin carboxyl carrier protein
MREMIVAIAHEDNKIAVQSPSVGTVYLTVLPGQQVQAKQSIAKLVRLGQSFDLILPEKAQGQIMPAANFLSVRRVSYAETLFCLTEFMNSLANEKNKMPENPTHADVIRAPMDGMFYLSPSPKSPNYVKLGDEIAPGATIGLMEVMKCFYPLKYEGHKRAKIVHIAVPDASPVSSGSLLFEIIFL